MMAETLWSRNCGLDTEYSFSKISDVLVLLSYPTLHGVLSC